MLGVQLILLDLLKKPELLSLVFWLLKSPQTLWGKTYDQEIRISLENQLAFMSQFPNNSTLLSKLGDKSLILAIFFYQISSGKVPSNIYRKIKLNLTKIFGVTIKEEFNFIRSLRKSINIFQKEMLYCFGWMILWFTIFAICENINPSLMIIPMIANLPLISFYLIGLILMGVTQIFLQSINYYEYSSSDENIMIISVIFNILLLPYLLNYIYRYQLFKNKKIGFRIKEFFVWLIPFFLLYAIVTFLMDYLS